MFANIQHSKYKRKTYKGYLNLRGVPRIGDDWHIVEKENAKFIIALNQSSFCEITKRMVLDFKDRVSKHEKIYVPYNHLLLRPSQFNYPF